MSNNTLHLVAFTLLVVGGLNWLLVGLFDWDISMVTDGISPLLTKAIYVLVGLSAIYEVMTHKKNCRACGDGM
jgi:hypothetical protein